MSAPCSAAWGWDDEQLMARLAEPPAAEGEEVRREVRVPGLKEAVEVVYRGGVQEGRFHGQGEIFAPSLGAGVYRAHFYRGADHDSEYTFADGLPYSKKGFKYLKGKDRRYWRETQAGVRAEDVAAPSPSRVATARAPPPRLPAGCHDVGDGYLDHETNGVHDYETGELLRLCDAREAVWAMSKCREGVEGEQPAVEGDDAESVAPDPEEADDARRLYGGDEGEEAAVCDAVEGVYAGAVDDAIRSASGLGSRASSRQRAEEAEADDAAGEIEGVAADVEGAADAEAPVEEEAAEEPDAAVEPETAVEPEAADEPKVAADEPEAADADPEPTPTPRTAAAEETYSAAVGEAIRSASHASERQEEEEE